MDKTAIKTYAIWARNELLKRVILKATLYGIERDKDIDEDYSNRLFQDEELRKRKVLIEKIKVSGFDETMEEIAYTWFNRFIALRFMEVNGYLPSKVRVFTDENNRFNPQVITEAINLRIPGLDVEKVVEYERSSDRDGLFKYIIITQCNALNEILPGMFEKIDDYTEFLIPDNLLREGSVIHKMIEIIPEEDWKNQVQIIGWLYQYYNTEPKDRVFAQLKNREKITREKIPAVTQLFTPDWIVKYMVENSLGRMWNECDHVIKESWKYYMESVEQTPDIAKKIGKIREEISRLAPEEVRCIDPCVGSGHILCYLFDMFIDIYEYYGHKKRDAVRVIIEKNLYGLDIDRRAKQLAYFSVMMKAREYDRRFFERDYIPQPHIYVIDESNFFKEEGKFTLEYFVDGNKTLKESMDSLIQDMHDAKEYGSIIDVKPVDFKALYKRFDELRTGNLTFHTENIFERLLPLVKLGEVLSLKYHIVITNPPYMGGAGMNEKLAGYVKKNYPDSSSDLFAVFIERCKNMAIENGFIAMITQHSWMFLSSYERLREKIENIVIENMAHLGPRAFEEIVGEVVQTAAFILRNSEISGYRGRYVRLVDGNSQDKKEEMFLSGENRYEISQDEFKKIPGKPIAYWASENLIKSFETGEKMDLVLDVRQGLATGNNNEFLRMWYEVDKSKCKWDSTSIEELFKSGKRWIPYNKGGKYRKWYGNYDYLIKFDRENYEKLNNQGNNLPSKGYYFKPAITWGLINSSGFSIRYRTSGGVHDVSGMSAFYNGKIELEYILGLMSTPVAEYVFNLLNPTINLQAGDFKNFPVLIDENHKEEVIKLAKENIELAKADWDMHETSWDFNPPFRKKVGKIRDFYMEYKAEVNKRFERLKSNEERLNEIFISLYGLEKDLKKEVLDSSITVAKIFDLKSDITEEIKGNRYILTCEDVIKNFISYGVGCILGRYRVDGCREFEPCEDGIIPITEEEYFENDMGSRFISFVEEMFGEENLEENLEFIGAQLKGKGNARERIRNYFVNDFYSNHCKLYDKRPIYWQLDSGKKNGIKIIIYIHTYKKDSIAKARVKYIHEIQGKYNQELARFESLFDAAHGSERLKLGKKVTQIKDKIEEVGKFEERVHHIADAMIELDLDDGVKRNYKLFGDIFGKIK